MVVEVGHRAGLSQCSAAGGGKAQGGAVGRAGQGLDCGLGSTNFSL